jgi:lipopolysaccharide/colanic/teichoic acid biosynthesis glycosyltransferase
MKLVKTIRNYTKVQTEDIGSQNYEGVNLYADRMYIKRNMDKPKANSPLTYRWWKSILDRLAALFLIIMLSPFLALVALIIRLDSPGNIVFRREQVGESGKKFTLYKFRTMRSNNNDYKYKAYLIRYILEDAPYKTDQNGQGVYKVTDDPRVTRFGTILRKTNIDELPQLFNILRGEMSFIGPRPDIPFAVNMYNDWHLQRLNIKPGITGLWQIGERKRNSFRDMVNLDIEYIKKQSLLLDIKISLLTIFIILKMDGS